MLDSRVVLPDPVDPTTTSKLPEGTVKLTFLRHGGDVVSHEKSPIIDRASSPDSKVTHH